MPKGIYKRTKKYRGTSFKKGNIPWNKGKVGVLRLKNPQQKRREKNTYYHRNKERILKNTKIRTDRNLRTWLGIIPSETQCEICGKKIYFHKGRYGDLIRFDHRKEGIEPIKINPTNWLRAHPRTPKNEVLWKSCSFGIVCNWCNRILPTKNRVIWAKRIFKYLNFSRR